jgi:hypothetical protein
MNGIGGISQKGFTFSKEKAAIGKTSFANSAFNIQTENIGAVQSDVNGLLLSNPSLATFATQQLSPPIVLQGNGWKNTSAAGSQDVRFRIDVLPVFSNGSNPTGTLRIGSSINDSAYTNRLTIDNFGTVVVSGGTTIDTNGLTNLSKISWLSGSFGSNMLCVGSNVFDYKTTNGGATQQASVSFAGGFNRVTAGTKSVVLSNATGDLLGFVVGNGSIPILTAKIDLLNLVTTAGAEAGDLGFYTKPTGSAATLAFVINKLGGISNTGSAAVNTYCALKAGTTTIAPLKITSGTNMTSPAGGTIEYNGSHYETGINSVRYGKGGVVANTYTTVDNSTTTETSLFSYISPANFFTTLGDKCDVTLGGSFLGHASNTRQLKVYFGGTAGTLIFDSGAMSVTSTSSWKIEINLQMSASGKVKYTVILNYDRSVSFVSSGELTATLTTEKKIELTGTGVSTGDISLYMGQALYSPVSNS